MVPTWPCHRCAVIHIGHSVPSGLSQKYCTTVGNALTISFPCYLPSNIFLLAPTTSLKISIIALSRSESYVHGRTTTALTRTRLPYLPHPFLVNQHKRDLISNITDQLPYQPSSAISLIRRGAVNTFPIAHHNGVVGKLSRGKCTDYSIRAMRPEVFSNSSKNTGHT